MKAISSIGLLGGSFNPVHNGHIAIVNSFLASPLVDELWILLTPQSPHKKNENLADYSHRFNMLNMAFKDIGDVKVSDFENHLPKPSYSIQTVTALKKEYPEKEFYFCVGQDSLAAFNTWHKWEELIQEVDILIASRPHYSLTDIEQNLQEKAHFIDHEEIDISSSLIREKVANRVDVHHLIPDSVLAYIEKNNLYTVQH